MCWTSKSSLDILEKRGSNIAHLHAPQALKTAGVSEVVLAINYQPEVRQRSLCAPDSLHARKHPFSLRQ
jgi:hypothetical protein